MRGAREITAAALLPFVLIAIRYLPPWVYLGLIWVVAMMAAWELLSLQQRLGHPTFMVASLALLAAGLPAVWLGGLAWSGPVLAAQVVLLPLAYLLCCLPLAGATAGIAGVTFATAYFTVTGGAMGLLRTSFPDAMGWKVVLVYCIAIWAGDSGAYYLGSRFGKHRLAPVVSPKKSWEGILGGAIGTAAAVWICRALFFAELPGALAWSLVAILTVLAPLGDLVESLFKRDAGVKDSSALIPGHGGFLDRSDSLFYAAPFVLALFLLFEGSR